MPHIHRKVSCIAAKERPEKFVRSNNWLCKQTSRLRARFKRISDRRRQQPSRQDPSRPIRIHTSKRKTDNQHWMTSDPVQPPALHRSGCTPNAFRHYGYRFRFIVEDQVGCSAFAFSFATDRNSAKPLLDASSPSSHSNAQALRLKRSGCAFSVLLHRFRVPMTTTCSSVHVRRAVVAWNVPFLIHGFHEKIPVHLDIPLRIP